jgi:membrane-associated phospholipid phosphatase
MNRRAAVLVAAALATALPVTAQADFIGAVAPQAEPSPPPNTPAHGRPPSIRDDKRRTMKSYWNNLAYNFLGVVTPGNYEPLLVTAALTAPAFAWDEDGKKYFADHPHENFADIGQTLGGTVAVAGLTIGAFSASRIRGGDRFRATTYDISQAIIVTQVWTQGLKFAVRRERPDESNNLSFPSGHASNAFCAAAVISRHYRILTIPGYGVATYIAVSRMAANKHHFSDIVAGAGFGYSVGRLVTRRNSRDPDLPKGSPATARLSVVPDSGPSRDGTGLRVQFVF